MISSIAGSYFIAHRKVGDARVDSLGDLSGSFSSLWHDTHEAMTFTFTNLFDYDNGTAWEGFISLGEVLEGGHFLNAQIDINQADSTLLSLQTFHASSLFQSTQALTCAGAYTQAIRDATLRFFEAASINALWRSQSVFAIFVPYGKKIISVNPLGGDDRWFKPFKKEDCNKILSELGSHPTGSCDGEGMTFLVGDPGVVLGSKDVIPPGAESPMNLTGGTIGWRDIMASSVGGWLHSGFDSNITNPLYKALSAGPGTVDSVSVADLTFFAKINARTEGLFNIPVCKLYDLRWILGPRLSYVQHNKPYYKCMCLSDAANSPAKPNQKFRQFIEQDLIEQLENIAKEHITDCYLGD